MKTPLGQNFLNDQRVLNKIVEGCDFTPQDTVVEIGPGKGSLTRLLASRLKTLYAIEYDRGLLPALHTEFDNSNVQIIHSDFLKWNFKGVPAPIKVIGNIPYYISTSIIEHLLEHRVHITEAFLTVQKEFGERLAAKPGGPPALRADRPGGKDYGSLSCFVQYYADVKVLFKIKNTCFTPPPKVDSCFVRLAFHPKPVYQPKDEQKMFTVIRTAFAQRRKTIVNALSPLAGKDALSAVLTRLGLSPQARPETLSLQNYVDISDALC